MPALSFSYLFFCADFAHLSAGFGDLSAGRKFFSQKATVLNSPTLPSPRQNRLTVQKNPRDENLGRVNLSSWGRALFGYVVVAKKNDQFFGGKGFVCLLLC